MILFTWFQYFNWDNKRPVWVFNKSKNIIVLNGFIISQRTFHVFDDVTALGEKVMFLIRQKEEVAILNTVNGKIIEYLKYSKKLVSKNLFELFEWDSDLFDQCINQPF